jgi:hypothetical protein
MKKILFALVGLLFISHLLMGNDTIHVDELQRVNNKKRISNKQRKSDRKEFSSRFIIGIDAMYSFLNSTARFEGPNGVLSAQIDLEKHLGLEENKMIYSGSAIVRITPRSSFYGVYYQLNRKKDHLLDRDIYFLGDTINKGVLAGGYLKTSVASFGYMFSILPDEDAFLGAYLNAYVIDIKLGVSSEVFDITRSARYFAAWPNFGLLANFKINNWFSLAGSAGMFFINTGYWHGNFNDFHLLTVFHPTKWLGVSLGYHVFDVKAGFPEDYFTAYFNYNYKGPSAGLKFRF